MVLQPIKYMRLSSFNTRGKLNLDNIIKKYVLEFDHKGEKRQMEMHALGMNNYVHSDQVD